jgi:hypothetical protein
MKTKQLNIFYGETHNPQAKNYIACVLTNYAPVKTDQAYVKTDNAQVETDNSYVKTDIVSVKTYNTPVQTDKASVQTDDTQVKTDKAHVLTDKPSVECFVTKFNAKAPFKYLFSAKVANFYIKCEKMLHYGSTRSMHLTTITNH